MQTRRGLPVSASQVMVVEQYDTFVDRLARIAPGSEAILTIADSHPGELLPALAAANLLLYGQTESCQTAAAGYLGSIAARASGGTAWEAAWFHALARWHAKDFDEAASCFEQITERWPTDLAAVKAAEFLYYILGQHYCGPRFRAHMERLASHLGSDPDYLAARAFAHELCGDLQAARHYTEEALVLEPHLPWAHHCMAHLMLWEGNHDEAARCLEEWLPTWRDAGRVIHCHNAWHTALMHLDRLEVERAWSIYHEHIWPFDPDSVGEQIDAIALLWRMELAEIVVPPSCWEVMVPHVLPHIESVFMPFLSIHHAYALARAGEMGAVEALVAHVRERAAESDHEARRVWASVGLDAVEAAVALARRDDRLAAEKWCQVLPRITQVGGSDAQNDLFRFSHIESLLRIGAREDARETLTNRLQQKSPSPLEERVQCRVQG